MLSASGGFAPWLPDQGLCPWTPLGAPPPDPHIGSRSRARHILSVPVLFLTGNGPWDRQTLQTRWAHNLYFAPLPREEMYGLMTEYDIDLLYSIDWTSTKKSLPHMSVGETGTHHVACFILFKHRQQRVEATYMPVKSIQWTYAW